MSSHLQQIPLFRELEPEELKALLAATQTQDLDDGDLLFRQGDESEHAYIVRRGNIRIFAEHDGVEETYTTLGMGAVFGEIGVMKKQPRSASAVAEGPASVWAFEGEIFEALCQEYPAIAKMVMQTMFGRFKNDARREERRTKAREDTTLIPVFSSTGGAGTSLVTANLATYVKELSKKKVLILDLDLMFGDQGAIFSLEGESTISDFVMEETIEAGDLLKLVQSTPQGVDVLKAPARPEEAEFCSAEFIGLVLDQLLGHYDFIFCDTPTQLVDITLDLFDRAHTPIYVVTPEITSIRNAARWVDVVERIGLPTDDLRFLVNKVEASDETTLAYVEKRFGGKVLDQLPWDARPAKESLNRGEILDVAAPKSELAGALRRTAGKLLGIEIDTTPKKTGLLSRWI